MSGSTKTETVKQWPVPKKLLEMQHFLGFVQYVCKFIPNFSSKATPLTNLLKGKGDFTWSNTEQAVFESLKAAMCSTPVLKLPNISKPFEIHTDASDMAYGAVLMQDGHPIAYESRKFIDSESRWPTLEKEMLVVVQALRKRRHFVQDKPTSIFTDSSLLQYFLPQPKLSLKQAR